jgi:hypothetical protein
VRGQFHEAHIERRWPHIRFEVDAAKGMIATLNVSV